MTITASWARRSVWAVLLAVLASGCRYGPDVRGPFQGEIVDADTGQPIEGAVVVVAWTHTSNFFQDGRHEVDAREAVTDAQGRWEIPERPMPPWEGGIASALRRFYVFAPGHEVVDRRGTPSNQYQYQRETTVTTMRRLTTREARCKFVFGLEIALPSTTVGEKTPRYFAAIEREREFLKCDSRM
jgi:hypothetical protein